MIRRAIILLITTGLVLVGCGPKADHPRDRLKLAYEKIDKSQYDEAIADLKELVADTNSDRAREALASAYAARAGVSVKGYWQFIASFAVPNYEYGDLNQRFITRALKDSEERGESSPLAALAKGMEPLIQSLSLVQEYAYRLELLKPLANYPNEDFDRALALLGEVDPQRRGSYLYRGLLRLVLIKTLLYQRAESFHMRDPKNSCHLHLSGVKEGVEVIGLEVRRLLYDLRVVYPAQTRKLEKHDKFLEELMLAIRFVPAELDLRDFDISLTYSFFTLDQDLWRCSGD